MGWGYRIAILTMGFVCFMTFLVVSAVRQDFDLVAEDYYSKEIAFQSQIEKQKNQLLFKDSLSCIVSDSMIIIKFPHELNGKKIEGKIYFFRPSDARKDLVKIVAPSAQGLQLIEKSLLSKGMYRVQFDYASEGKEYYCEKTIMIR